MTVLLDALDTELDAATVVLDAAKRRVEALRQARTLLAGLDGVGEGADTAADPVGTAIAATAGATPPPATVGALPPAATTAAAVRDSEVAAAGETSVATSAGRNGADAPGAPGGAPGSSLSPARQPAQQARAAGGAKAMLLDALANSDGATVSELSESTGLEGSTVQKTLNTSDEFAVVGRRRGPEQRGGPPAKVYALKTLADRLVAELGTRGKGPGAKPGQAAAAKTEAEVLRCILEGQGLVDEPEISAQLELDREHVALATGALLEAGAIALNPDGTYTATGGGSQ